MLIFQICCKEVADARASLNEAKPRKEYYSVINELLQSALPEEEKRDERLFLEATVIINAGTETTAWSRASSS